MLTNEQLLTSIAPSSRKEALYQVLAVLGIPGETANIIPMNRQAIASIDSRQKVLCIGGGIAGLVAGLELNRLGITYEIHEARPKIGGRCETIRASDIVTEFGSQQVCHFGDEPHLYFNSGAARIPQSHGNINHYCLELGVSLEEVITHGYAPASDAAHTDGTARTSVSFYNYLTSIATDAASQEQVTPSERAGISRIAELLSELSSSLEFATAAELMAAFKAGELPPVLATIALEHIAKLDWPEFKELFYYEKLHEQTPMFQPVGGMDRIARALVKAQSEHLKTSSALKQVRTMPSGQVEAIFDDQGVARRRVADVVIFTMQPTIFNHVENDFSHEISQALSDVHLFNSCKVAFETERFWERDDRHGGSITTTQEIYQLRFPSHGLGHENGVLIGAYNLGLDPRETFYRRTPEQRIQAAINQGENIQPNYRKLVRNGVTRSWPLTPYIGGGFAAIRAPEILLKRHGPYIFAGDYTSFLPGWQEGATLSAHRALRLLAQRH